MEAVVLAVLGAVIVAVYHGSRLRAGTAVWSDFAKRLGLVYEPRGFFRRPTVGGSVGRFGVRLEGDPAGDARSETRLVVDAEASLPRSLSIGAERPFASIRRAIGDTDIETGDAAFDAGASVFGSRDEALAVLSADTRRRVERALSVGVRVESGKIVLRNPGLARDSGTLVSLANEMLALAEALSIDVRPVPGRLLENVKSDPNPVFRRRCLESLVERYPDRDVTRAALRAALADRSPETRVLAAEKLPGDEGSGALEALALADDAGEETRARAVRALARRPASRAAAEVIERLLRDRGAPALRHAAVAAAGALRIASAIPLLGALEPPLPPETAEAVALALREIGDPAGEDAAIALLASEDAKVRTAAARALEKIGSRRAVEPLHPIATSKLSFGAARTAAISAIRAIQSRLAGAEHGGLALPDAPAHGPGEGALAFPNEAGNLAMPEVEEPPPGEKIPDSRRKPTAEGA